MKVYFATDHAGFEMKNALVAFVRELGHEVEDCGALVHDESDDYPEYIAIAARKLSADAAAGLDSRAILLGGSGQAEAMVANRFKGVRAAVYYGQPRTNQTDAAGRELDIVASTREHNDANAFSIGARFINIEEAKVVVRIWLERPFTDSGRHARRIKQIDQVTGYSVYE
jgi:ribose 5-phosphate isomerase B